MSGLKINSVRVKNESVNNPIDVNVLLSNRSTVFCDSGREYSGYLLRYIMNGIKEDIHDYRYTHLNSSLRKFSDTDTIISICKSKKSSENDVFLLADIFSNNITDVSYRENLYIMGREKREKITEIMSFLFKSINHSDFDNVLYSISESIGLPLDLGYCRWVNILLKIFDDAYFLYGERYMYSDVESYDIDGVILIERIEAFMNPIDQKYILHQLSKLFPNIQFIVTTNSPIILGEVNSDYKVFQTDKKDKYDKLLVHEIGTFGRSYNDILKLAYDINSRNDDIIKIFNSFYDYMDNAEYDKSRETLNDLYNILGNDVELTGMETALSLEDNI